MDVEVCVVIHSFFFSNSRDTYFNHSAWQILVCFAVTTSSRTMLMFSTGIMEGAYFVGRGELLTWINNLVGVNYTKIEQTASGAAHCIVLNSIYPGKQI